MFFVHSKLLERAGNFTTLQGETSITALVVAETAQGDLSGYIQTNIMSMTDGHIFFDIDLFLQGRRPAINSALSVTRVGKQVQHPLKRDINRELNSFFSYAEKMRSYTHFGQEASQTVKSILDMEERILDFFNQPLPKIIPSALQVFVFALIWQNKWKEVSREKMLQDIDRIVSFYESNPVVSTTIANIVGSASSLNMLLGNIAQHDLKFLGGLF
jgi:F-type H+/Na+-transporting ATPase subunit alpha